MLFRTVIGAGLVTLFCFTQASADNDRVVIPGTFIEWDFGSFVFVKDLPPAGGMTCEDDPTQVQCEGFRHITSFVNKKKNEVVLFGGINDFPFRGPNDPIRPINNNVFTLDLEKNLPQRKWEFRSTDDEVDAPWFTTTKGFATIGKKVYLASDDTDAPNFVWSFNPKTYTFEEIATTEFEPDEFTRASDGCAVGVTVPYENEERIYHIGGRNQAAGGTTNAARYYSITNDEWIEVESMAEVRSHLGCAAVYRNGKPLIYAVGGGDGEPDPGVVYKSIEVYDVLEDEWETLSHTLLQARTRMGVVNVDNKHLIVVGGDATCAGGGGSNCEADRPLDTLEVIDIKRGNKVFSSDEYQIPKLNQPRQTPATTLAVMKGKQGYELLLTGGHTCKSPQDPGDPCSTGIEALRNTEVLNFVKILSPPMMMAE